MAVSAAEAAGRQGGEVDAVMSGLPAGLWFRQAKSCKPVLARSVNKVTLDGFLRGIGADAAGRYEGRPVEAT